VLAGRDVLGTAGRDASDRHTNLSYEATKNHSLGPLSITATWSDPTDPFNQSNPYNH
jgi:hypothetical protein